MKPIVLIAANFLPRLLGRMQEHYDGRALQPSDPSGIPPDARDARALITIGSVKTDAALIDALPKLGLIACYGTGYEGVDLAAARARGIAVTHAGDTNSTAASNTHAVNKEILAALGPRGHLINISRGIAVDEAALCDALEAGTIAGAALDVYEREPHIPERLFGLDNVVLTPHMAAISANAQRAQRDIMFANLEAFFAGRPVLTPVPE
jgi:lactate dehydrogenase-like 2-hydroxyacid dehydrogenase